jgi:hypothetical protein
MAKTDAVFFKYVPSLVESKDAKPVGYRRPTVPNSQIALGKALHFSKPFFSYL